MESDGESWGERFINLFIKAFSKKEAEVRIDGNKVVFDIKPLNEQFMVKPRRKDLQGLLENIFSRPGELAIEPWAAGFKIVVKE